MCSSLPAWCRLGGYRVLPGADWCLRSDVMLALVRPVHAWYSPIHASRHLIVNWLTIIFGAVGGTFGAALVINDVITGEESGGGH